MRRWLRIGRCVMRVSMSARLAYLGEVLARAVFLVLILFVFRQLYARVLPAGQAMAGFDASSVFWYVVVTEALIFAAPRVDGLVDQEVKSGHVATFLTRPLSYVDYHQWRYLGALALTLPLNLLVGGLLGLALVGAPRLESVALVAVPVTMLLGSLINFHISMLLALGAFWIEDATPLFWVYQKTLFILGGLLIPLDFFPDWLQGLADALPFSLILYAPARLTVGFELATFQGVVLRQLLWLAVLAVLARSVCRVGLRRVCVHGG